MSSFVVALLCLISSVGAAENDPGKTRPNIVLCMKDDQGWGNVNSNGLKKIQTPNIDVMAGAGEIIL